MPKLTILTFVPYYLPGYKAGGPTRTISNMVERLGDDFEFRIVCADRDFLDVTPYPGIAANTWCRVGKAWVYYASPVGCGILEWVRLMRRTPHDLVYLNSFFHSMYALRPLLATKLMGLRGKPVVLAPRGEFSPGALGLKLWKKMPFLLVAKLSGFYRDVLWHASTKNEAQHILQRMGGDSAISISLAIAVARDLSVKMPDVSMPSDVEHPPDVLRIVFFSRIARMKNLDYALRVLAKTRVKIKFDIWGTLEDSAYWEECQDLIQTMPQHVEVHYCGVLDHAEVPRILSGYDLFFLPTRGENYGHVIAEAVSAGTPVLLSDQTSWRNLHNEGVGWDLPLENGEAAFLEAIEEALHKVRLERVAWRQRVVDFATDQLNNPSILVANRALFLRAVADKA